jgi:mono/diheme cytochrome c family protein
MNKTSNFTCKYFSILALTVMLSAGLHVHAAEISELMVQRCAACHGPTLRGVGGVFPDLMLSEKVRAGDVDGLTAFVINGSGPESTSLAKMPPRGGFQDLTDTQIKDLIEQLVELSNNVEETTVVAENTAKFGKRYGPVIGTAIELGKTPDDVRYIVSRAHLVPLGESREASVVFDSDTMSYSVAWFKAEELSSRGMPFGGAHGRAALTKSSTNLFSTGIRPGWAKGGVIADPRPAPYRMFPPMGALPKDWAHFKGHYVHDGRTIFRYSVGKGDVLDMPGLVEKDGLKAITRTLKVQNRKASILVLAEANTGKFVDKTLVLKSDEQDCSILMVEGPQGAELVFEDHVALLKLPKGDFSVKLAFWQGDAFYQPAIEILAGPAEDLSLLTQGGKAQWGEAISAKSELSTDKESAYVVDRLGIPKDNPLEPRMRIGGFDFFDDGKRAAVCTWDGDVWIVSGIDDALSNVTWKRFATGLHEPLGLTIADGVIYTVADDQITRFHDLNKDGEADFYENFNNDWDATEGFHAFCFDLQTGPKGDFFFSMGCPVRAGGRGFERLGRQHGSIIRVSKDGRKLTRYASGFRAPNGIGVGPDGQVTCGDNEGSFVPAAPLNWVEPGGFYGVVDAYQKMEKLKTDPIGGYEVPQGEWRNYVKSYENYSTGKTLDPKEMPKPLVWMSKARRVDNSGGGQVWVTSDRWGPLNDALLHLSYGRSTVALVLKEKKKGQMQGGVYDLGLNLSSSAMRARVNPRDGQVYVAGLKGWQTNARKAGGIDRIRYTGKPVYMPLSLNVHKGRIELGFSQTLSPAEAADIAKYRIQAWNIEWTHRYGSPETPVEGFAIEKAELHADGRTVSLHVPDLRPVHMMEIHFDLLASDGTPIKGKIDNTIHVAK